MTKKYRNIIIALVSIALMVSITACAKNEQESGEQENTETVKAELSDAQLESLMKQVAESDVTKSYGDHLRDEAFANAEVFGIDRDHVFLGTSRRIGQRVAAEVEREV